ncbi:MAG: Asp-tRNA(Asn)/Glu-tRNA(Gln) amidotransferase subunit GatA [Clostridiales bacterium]|nr:Asp-tRNA(Asn)/Glu-tRNA(Gln) amidotransferase subunit GatA [Clostridiales bacterium]
MDIRKKTALELGQLIKERKLSSPELTRIFLDAAKGDHDKPEGSEGKLNAYTEVLEESAMDAAAAVQARIDKGENLSPLAGVPMAMKDNICTTEGRTTAASKILAGFRSPFDADAAEKLKSAGAVILGRTNMDEFAMGSSTENSCYGTAHNPWNLSRVPGGSSGGSAAAVAAGLAPYALGSDTGGSVRQPCGFTGLTGIKPTYGSVSRHGLVAYASSLDQIGPMALDACDASVILSIISGPDGRDSTMGIDEPFRPCGIMHGETEGARLDGIKIGLPASYFGLPALDSSIKANVLAAAETLHGLGAEVRDIELPLLDYGVPAYLAIACAEAASNLARYDGVKYGYRAENAATIEEVYAKTRGEGFGDEAKRRILFGYFVLSSENFETYFRQAQRVRGMIKKAYDGALENCDFILTPVSPSSPYEIGTRISDPLEMYIGDIYTASLNLTGLPGAAAPCGFDKDGMPTGMQLVGKAFSDIAILDIIARYQRATDHHMKRPPLYCPEGGVM